MKIAAFVALTLTAAISALADPLTGDVFPEKGAAVSLFQVERSWKTNGSRRTLTECFKEKTGALAVSLEASYVSNHLTTILFDQKQSREKALAEFKEGRVNYTVTAGGKVKQSSQKVSTEWTPFPAVPDQIAKNWDSLVQGATVKLTIPIPIMRDNFTFEVSKTRTWTENSKQLTEFKLEPSSLAIRLLASAMYYVYEDKTRTLIEYRGRTMVRTEKSGKLEDLNALIKYRPAPSTSR